MTENQINEATCDNCAAESVLKVCISMHNTSLFNVLVWVQEFGTPECIDANARATI